MSGRQLVDFSVYALVVALAVYLAYYALGGVIPAIIVIVAVALFLAARQIRKVVNCETTFNENRKYILRALTKKGGAVRWRDFLQSTLAVETMPGQMDLHLLRMEGVVDVSRMQSHGDEDASSKIREEFILSSVDQLRSREYRSLTMCVICNRFAVTHDKQYRWWLLPLWVRPITPSFVVPSCSVHSRDTVSRRPEAVRVEREIFESQIDLNDLKIRQRFEYYLNHLSWHDFDTDDGSIKLTPNDQIRRGDRNSVYFLFESQDKFDEALREFRPAWRYWRLTYYGSSDSPFAILSPIERSGVPEAIGFEFPEE